MNLLLDLNIVLLILRSTRAIFRNLWLWQVKEYRLDRILIHYRTTPEGRKELMGPVGIIKWILFILSGLYSLHGLIWILFPLSQIKEILLLFKEVLSRTHKRPKVFTARIVLSLTITLALVLLLLNLTIDGNYLPAIILVDRLTTFFVAVAIGLTAMPSVVYKKLIVYRATQKRKSLPNLKVVGITGSVGKTSTKYFLNSILAHKFRTVATSLHDNTDIGIARRLLNDVNETTEVFIAEMGAYKIGEIKYLCQIALPQYGILTYIGSQHLDLFGSQENIQKAKLELIENLNNEKAAILNLDSPLVKDKLDNLRKMSGINIVTYSTQGSADVLAREIKQEKDGILFTLIIENKSVKVKANIYGKHFISNILAAAGVAWKMGMNLDEIKAGIGNIQNPPDAVNKLNGPKGSILFDDTYNASPESVEANVELLNSYPGIKTRILVLQPMIELGEETKAAHIRVGEYLRDKKIDLLILTNSNFNESITAGAKENKEKIKIAKNASEVQDFLKPVFSQSTGIIFKGKESTLSLKRLIS